MAMRFGPDSPEEFKQLPMERQAALLDWIEFNLIPIQSYNEKHTSYGIKHLIHLEEHENSYFTNGEFKGAMLEAGYRVKNMNSQNWIFNVSEKSPAFHAKP